MPTTHTKRDGDIAVITLDHPPVNGLALPLRTSLLAAVQQADKDASIKAMVLTGNAKVFCAGADISEFGLPAGVAFPLVRHLAEAFDEVRKPMVAAIGGLALGGGLELALACHYRVASPRAKLGMPEVNLGLVASGGGTQRLPRAIAVDVAARMITSGDPISSAEALELGLIDKIATGDVLADAIAYARSLVAAGGGIRRLRDVTPKLDNAAAFFAAERARLAKAARGNPAVLRALDCVEATLTLPFDQGRRMAEEARDELLNGVPARALRHAFFAEREAQKIPDVPDSTPKRPLNRAAVIGAGTMGGGIAMSFVNAGIPVTLIEMKQEALDRGLATIRNNYAATVSKGRLAQADMDARMALITPALDLAAARDADIVVEAVFERMEVKQEVFRKLDAVARPGAILASNTSTLDVDRIAAATSRPADVIGTHFFSPANVMRLLEVVRGAKTGKDVLATTMALARRIGKVAVVSGVCDGFIGNRMLGAYLQQANFLLDEGATPEKIDGALTGWGLAMGPFTMGDMAGGDIGWETRKRRRAEDPNFAFSRIPDLVYEKGRYGLKTGKGWYRYEQGSRTPLPDPEIAALIEDYRNSLGLPRRDIGDEEIVGRCLFALANEAARILEEGIALRASDVDAVYLTGYGFPRYRGGPLFHADVVGLPKVLAAIERFSKGYQGQVWTPAPLLAKLVKEGKTFADFDKSAR